MTVSQPPLTINTYPQHLDNTVSLHNAKQNDTTACPYIGYRPAALILPSGQGGQTSDPMPSRVPRWDRWTWLCLWWRGMQNVPVKSFPWYSLSLLHLEWTWQRPPVCWAFSHGEKGKDTQGFYSADNIRTKAAPWNSTRLAAFPSNTLDVNYLLELTATLKRCFPVAPKEHFQHLLQLLNPSNTAGESLFSFELE